MPVVGAVLTLAPGAPTPDAIGRDPRFTIGERIGDRLPVALSTDTHREDLDTWDRVRDLPGVLQVQVAFADLSDLIDSRGVQ